MTKQQLKAWDDYQQAKMTYERFLEAFGQADLSNANAKEMYISMLEEFEKKTEKAKEKVDILADEEGTNTTREISFTGGDT